MKLHLPTALRRALLALFALLSPAAVTTTLATATLAAISAPAMAADLTLSEENLTPSGRSYYYYLDSDITVDSISLSSNYTTASIQSSTPSGAPNVTVTASSINLLSNQTLYLNTVKIIAKDSIRTLLSNVGNDAVSLTTSQIWGAGGSSSAEALQSSLINEKLFPNGQSYVYVTEGHIIFNQDILGSMNLGLGDGNQSAGSGTVSATTSSTLDSLKIVYFESDATLNLDNGANDFTLNVYSLKGNVKTKRNLTLTANSSWNTYASMYGTSSISTEENSTASITLDKVKLLGGKVTADTLILKDILAYTSNEATLTAANKLLVQGDISLQKSKAIAGQTMIDAGKSLTLGAGAFTTGAVTIGTGASLTLGSTTNLKGIITNNGTLNLGGTIKVDSTAFTAGSRERYSDGNNGYKAVDTTYNVLTGNAATGSASWKVGTANATYENGMVILAGTADTSVYYVKNGDVSYQQSLAQADTIFSLEGGHLQLNESLLGTQSIVSKNSNSLVCLKNSQVELKSSQISLDGAEYVTLQAPDAGTYVIDKAVGGIVELTLGTGVKLAEGTWWGTVKTTGDTTVNSNVDTSSWINTELNGTTTVNNGASLTLGNNTRLNGKIVNNGTLVLGGNVTIDTSTFAAGDVITLSTLYQQGSSAVSMNSGFKAKSGGMQIQVVDGNAADATGVIWDVNGEAYEYTFEKESGRLHVVNKYDLENVFRINAGDTITYHKDSEAFTNINGAPALFLSLEGGDLKLASDLLNDGLSIRARANGTVEIGDGVTLNASQLAASDANAVTLTGSGSYTMKDGANTLGAGVSVGSDWTGTVKVSGGADALDISSLGVSGSTIELGAGEYMLATGDHTVDAAVSGTQSSLYMNGGALVLKGGAQLKDVYGASSITSSLVQIYGNITTDALTGSFTVINGTLQETTSGSAISISGNQIRFINATLGAVLNNNGRLTFGGEMVLKSSLLGATPDNSYWYTESNAAGDYGSTAGSGFRTIQDIYTVVTGQAAENLATWKVDDRAAEYAGGKVLAFREKDLTTYWVNSNTEVSLDAADDEFIAGTTTTIALNGGKLVMDTNTELTMQSHMASAIEIGEGVNLNAGQLDTSAADVTLSGKGSYTLGDEDHALNIGVELGSNWSGTVNTTGDTTVLELDKLGVSGSTVELGSNYHTLAARDQEVAANLNSTGKLDLRDNKLTLSGTNTLGKLDVGSLEIDGGSTTVSKALTTGGAITNKGELNLSGTSRLGGVITNNGTLTLAGTIIINEADFDAVGAVTIINPHYQQGNSAESMNSGFKSSDGMEIQVVTGNAANDSGANWIVNFVSNRSYAFDKTSGKLHVLDVNANTPGTSFYINAGDTITYDQNAAMFQNLNGLHASELVLNGGELVLSTELLNDTMKITAEQAGSVKIDRDVNLNASQLAASDAAVTLTGSGSYTMVAGTNTLGAGLSVGTGWTGTVKVSGGADALDISSLGVSGSKIYLSAGVYELSAGDHTIDAQVGAYGEASLKMSGGALTFNDIAILLGVEGASSITSTKFVDIRVFATTDALAGNIQVADGTLNEMTDGAEISTSGTVRLQNIKLGAVLNNSGSLTFSGNMVLDTAQLGAQPDTENWYSASHEAGEHGSTSGSGFRTIQDIYTVQTGQAAENNADWKVDDRDAEYDNGKVLAFREKDLTTYWVNTNTEVSLATADDEFISGTTTTIALNGGKLVMDTNTELAMQSHMASAIEIGEGATLNAGQLNTSAAGVTLSGKGSYTLESNANALNTGVELGSDWSGTVNTTGDTTALELDTLGLSGSKVELGSNSHTLAARDQEVAANLNCTGSVSLIGNKLTLSGENTLGSLNVGSLAITGGSTTLATGLTTGGESSVATGATLSIGGNSTLGGKIMNAGTLELGGIITVNKDTFTPGEAVENVTGYFIGSSTTPNSTNSGFEAACWDITIAEGGTITDNGATWKLVGDENATFDFAADGTLHAYGSGVGTVFHVAEGDSITYSESNAADFVNSKGEAATAIQLNGGTLELQAALDTTVKSAAASSVVIAESVNLNAGQLDASAAAVTLSGKGSYTMADGSNTLGSGVSVGSGWNGTVKLTGAADALELSSLGNALSSIDLGSFNHTLADGEHVIDSALMGSGTLALNEGSKLTLNGDCSNWSGDIIGQVKLELTEGGTIGGNVQVDSLHIGEGSSTTVDGNLTTTGTITVTDNATLSLNGNTMLGGTIESADSATVELAGQITVDVENFESSTVVKDVTGYFIGRSTTPNSTNSGFEAACWDITIAEGGTITDNGATWKLVGDENATFDFDEAGTLHAYGSGVGTVFHVAEGDSITYSESNAADFVNSKGEAVTAIQLNGGTLELQSALDTTVKSAAASSVVVAEGVNLNADQLDTSAADVTLRGVGSYSMQGQELSGVVELNSGVALDANEWKGTVYTGSMAQSAALDITALGNSQSTVWLGAQPMSRCMPGETVLESLTAAGVGTTVVPGSLTLQKGNSTAGALEMGGILTLGTADTAASLVADSVSLQGLSFAHADSTLVTGKLEGAGTLNVQLTDEVLSKKEAGETLTLVTLKEGFKGALTLNGSEETERVRSEDNRKEYTLAWNEDGTALTLSILGTETYVDEQVKPESSNSRAAVTMLTEVFLNSRPQKDAPNGALAGILNAVDAGTATDRDMSAVAGAATAALGMALSGDVERQLSTIRNRSVAGNNGNCITLASEKAGKQTGSRFFAWVNAESNRAEQNNDGTTAGYTLSSWGGTLGAGMQVNNKLTLGLALTAMRGDLQSDAADQLKGDMDTTYVSAFARYDSGKWSHAFIGTVGTMNADYKRTVSHSAGTYCTDGDTDGTAFGLMYEVSRGVKLNNRSMLSPVFNVSYRHTEVASYSESGADAALNVGKQSLDTVTAGAGARYSAVVGQHVLNRACGFEARALVKYDLGDRQSTASVGFASQATRADIEGAEMGAFGVELGAGISVPVGSGSIFADGAVELRSDYTNYNATVGYRIQF